MTGDWPDIDLPDIERTDWPMVFEGEPNDWTLRAIDAFERWSWWEYGASPWEDYGNRSDCPYFQGTGLCGYGCREEPSCITDEPRAGWPEFTGTINGIGGAQW